MKFKERVYAYCKLIPKGKVSTYKEIALVLNCKAYQAIGNALRANPYSDVPCHRVVKNDGLVGGYRGQDESKVKIEKLKEEGVEVENDKIDLNRFLYSFNSI